MNQFADEEKFKLFISPPECAYLLYNLDKYLVTNHYPLIRKLARENKVSRSVVVYRYLAECLKQYSECVDYCDEFLERVYEGTRCDPRELLSSGG